MDQKTESYYSSSATDIAALYESLTPHELYAQIQAFFKKGGLTVDVGSGSGRDVSWLNQNGFDAFGLEPVAEMVAIARAKHSPHQFESGGLSDLVKILKGKKATNLLCSGVLMHVPSEELITAVQTLVEALDEDGTLIVSTRPGGGLDGRDEHGRLFTPLPTGKTILLFESLGATLMNVVQSHDGSKVWDIFTFRKQSKSKYDGLHKIQEIINNDSKTTSYKFALLRSLCEVARKEIHAAKWKEDGSAVLIDVRILAEKWIQYYEGFVSAEISQHLQGGKLAFQNELVELKTRYPTHPIFEFRRIQFLGGQEGENQFISNVIRKVAQTILRGPVEFSGGGANPTFKSEENDGVKYVVVQTPVWMDIIRFSHWIEDSLILQWANWTKGLSLHRDRKDQVFRDALGILTADHHSPRDTESVKQILKKNVGGKNRCVWSNQILTQGSIHIDHIIPYSAIGLNSLWNLMPTNATINLSKSDKIPDGRQFGFSEPFILEYWQLYAKELPSQFFNETARSLGVKNEKNWEKKAFNELMLLVQRIAYSQGLQSWNSKLSSIESD